MPNHYLAFDLGAESGRVMLGTLDAERLALEEIHRFPTGGIQIAGSLRWSMVRMWEELKAGLRKVAASGRKIDSISTDSWGCDYVLLKKGEPMLSPPFHYRDSRTDGGYEIAAKKLPLDTIFEESGIQFMLINLIWQLQADVAARPEVLKLADQFLMVGDYVNWLLSGVAKQEESLASTSQIWNPRRKQWSEVIISKLGLPKHLFPTVVPSGTVLGSLLPEVTADTGLAGAKVVATCSHDTGAAVAAVPAEGEDWAYLSSGTWSLLGIESREAIITPASRKANFTNEVGWGSSIRFLKNIVGLWVVQECRRAWAAEGTEFSYEHLTELALQAKPHATLINPSDPRFVKPGDMPQKVQAYCRETGQPVPKTQGEIVRCALESLALAYRRTLEELEAVTGRKLKRLHIIGGGTKNQLLTQFAADATGREVIAGPVEATAIGNLLMQALALGKLKDLAHLRRVVRSSFPVHTYHAKDAAAWDAAYQRFVKLP
jgi:rhamnulokinase